MFLILVIAATVIGFYIFAFARRSSLRAQNPERAGFLAVNKYGQQRPSTHLATMQRLIERRFDEIVAKQRQVAEVMRRVPAPDSEEWLTIENALKCADRALQIQQNRYRIKSKEVAMLIWQEGIPSLASDLETLDFNQMGARLKVIDYAEKRGARLLKMLEVENAENVQVRHLMQSVTESLASLRGLSEVWTHLKN